MTRPVAQTEEDFLVVAAEVDLEVDLEAWEVQWEEACVEEEVVAS